MLHRLLGYFGTPRGPVRLAVLAWLLSLPALALGFQADDHVYAAARAEEVPGTELRIEGRAFFASLPILQ